MPPSSGPRADWAPPSTAPRPSVVIRGEPLSSWLDWSTPCLPIDGSDPAGSSSPSWPAWPGPAEPATSDPLPDLVGRIIAVHDLLDSLGVAHQFGGAIALAWYRNPRATTDIDLNITLAPADAAPVLTALVRLGVTVEASHRAAIERDGQARLDWSGTYLDLFFATLDLHHRMAEWARSVPLGPAMIPILAPEHLMVCKAIFDRPKDWVDIEAMVSWETAVDVDEVIGWLDQILGPDSAVRTRLVSVLRAPA